MLTQHLIDDLDVILEVRIDAHEHIAFGRE
jgi:hypothetical protein